MNSAMTCGGKTAIAVFLRDADAMTALKEQKGLFAVTMDGLRIKQMNEELFIGRFKITMVFTATYSKMRLIALKEL